MLDFSEALKRMKLGAKTHREGWSKATYLKVENHEFVLNYHGSDYVARWSPTKQDLLAEDWIDPAD